MPNAVAIISEGTPHKACKAAERRRGIFQFPSIGIQKPGTARWVTANVTNTKLAIAGMI